MKTIIKKYLVAIIMLVTSINYANEKATSINTIDGKKVRVEFKAVKKGHTLSIKNEDGTLIYSKELKNSGNFSQIFDLSKLEEGNYTTELEKDYEITVKYFAVLDNKISFNKEETIFKPVIRAENNLVLISKITFNKEPLKVSLYYKDELILSETITRTASETILNKVYRVSKEKKGDYKVIVSSNDRSYLKNFSL
ncbi:DUF3244 domain-containing protein [Polaribacter sp. IC073]|uniref:DUF3244 domain-containing protein n=1 Tax=Polaribacter sp. IC073 TaxID=2508540 RepID=UPI0011BF5AC5|nr:DUF3244 domain-containing protein [Polaribacter sp. IC073]TXD50129.1 hypothetical protein ES045_02825 [Polaribacter sp. IC073]